MNQLEIKKWNALADNKCNRDPKERMRINFKTTCKNNWWTLEKQPNDY